MAKLTAKTRNALPDSAFALSGRRYPIHDRAHAIDALARASGKPEEAQVRRAVKRRYPDIKLRKAMREALAKMQGEVEVSVPLWKDDAKQIVYGVVLTPGVRDSQGDIVSAGEIEKAAHRFLVEFRKHDVQHAETPAGVETVESFIAPQDMQVADRPVLKGSWVMATHVSDPGVWDRVRKGEITGYSIGGSGVRIPDAD
jgi:Putative phage serine protease XkdF